MVMHGEHVRKFRRGESLVFQDTMAAFSCRNVDREAESAFI
jgi:hypothetical protein